MPMLPLQLSSYLTQKTLSFPGCFRSILHLTLTNSSQSLESPRTVKALWVAERGSGLVCMGLGRACRQTAQGHFHKPSAKHGPWLTVGPTGRFVWRL